MGSGPIFFENETEMGGSNEFIETRKKEPVVRILQDFERQGLPEIG